MSCTSLINPTPRQYLRVTWVRTLGHVGGGNRCGGDNPLRVTTLHAGYQGSGLPKPRLKVSRRRLQGTGVVIAPSLTTPLGNQAASHCIWAFRSRGAPWTVTVCISLRGRSALHRTAHRKSSLGRCSNPYVPEYSDEDRATGYRWTDGHRLSNKNYRHISNSTGESVT